MDVQYYIEDAVFQNDMLNIRGWIFCNIDGDVIERAQIVIKSSSGLERRCNLEFKERKDVAEVYKLKNPNVGFMFKSIVKSFVSAKVYLEYFLKGEKNILEIIEICGDETDTILEKFQIEYPEVSGFYDIENFERLYSTNSIRKEIINKSVDVIIPIYNGFSYLNKLFESLYHTKLMMRIIVINDCSPDKRIDKYMSELCQKKDNIIYIKNAVNMGFVKSVNKGLTIAKNDVALVNTDVEVPEQWLERLMYPIFKDKFVASTTPYTNCGTICSFPEMGKDNRIFDNRSLIFVDTLFKNVVPTYTEMPTGVGFCMGMSLKAIKEVGLLDEKNFGKGYGEENDWCQRAIKKGYKNVHVENLFVYHKHGGSFQSEEKNRLLEENTKKLLYKYPEYMKDIAVYFENDNNKVYRKYALFQCLMQIEAPTSLFFNHVLGGGANDYLLSKKEKIIESNEKYIEFTYNVYANNYQIQINYKDYELKLCSKTFTKLFSKIKLSNINDIYINELVTYPDVYSILHAITELKYFSQAKIIMLEHDYFSICPTINLLQDEGKYCYLQCETKVDCLQCNRYICDSKYKNIYEWRNEWRTFFDVCDSIIVFSNDSKTILEKIYGELKNIEVIPHSTRKMLEIKKKNKITEFINIGILGVLSDRKGLKIIKEILQKVSKNNLPINIIVVGTCEEDISGEHCTITGKYTREQLPSLMYLYDIDIIFISSVWPETFSYTTQEAIKMHMPVASFNLGAPAERISNYDKGLIIDKIDSECVIDKIWEYTQQDIKKKTEKVCILFIIEYSSFSSRYRVEHLREHLAYLGIRSVVSFLDKVDIDIINKYDIVSVYRCSDEERIQRIAEVTKKNKILLLYDIDDFIFEYKKIEYLDFFKTEEYKEYETYCSKIKKCMNLCDVLTTSTTTLAKEIKESFPDKKVIVCRNTACLEMQLLSEIAVEENKKDSSNKIVLGYFSGSHTHNKDWLLIEDTIINVMEENYNVSLMLVGALETGKKLSKFDARIKRIPFVDWRKLPKLLRSIDINLMPLKNELFQWCKSENKWTEAGLVEIPTVASWNIELEKVMIDGENVIFCETQEEWYTNINRLIHDFQLRKMIGKNAKNEVYATHLITSNSNFNALVDVLENKDEVLKGNTEYRE